jgi:Serine carboxypeptidase S28
MNNDLILANGVKPEWIVIGGSYPGALSAWFKSQYPTHALGAWSSSGVINAIYDYHLFDNSLFTSMSKSGSDCPDQVIKHYTFIEEQFLAN